MRPNKFTRSYCIFALGLLVISQAVFTAALRTYYVETLCKGGHAKINLRYVNSGILTSFAHWQDDFGECVIEFNPEQDRSVVLSLYKYNLEPLDKLIIESGHGFKVQLIESGDFQDEGKSFQADGVMRLHYSRNSSTLDYRHKVKFQFTFTQVHGGKCQYNEFQCDNRNCIDRKLVCDRHNHCGDNSDQENCYGPRIDDETKNKETKVTTPNVPPNYYSRVWVIAAVSVGAVVGVILIILFGVFLRGLIRKEKAAAKARSEAAAQSDSSHPTNPQPSVFTRIRQSFRRTAAKTSEQTTTTGAQVELKPEIYQVPSMYPQLPSNADAQVEPKPENCQVPSMYPQLPSAPNYSGVDNPNFKVDE